MEGEVGTDYGAGGSAGARKAKRFCIWQTFEVRPGFLGGDATELEYLEQGLDNWNHGGECLSNREDAYFGELVDFIFTLE